MEGSKIRQVIVRFISSKLRNKILHALTKILWPRSVPLVGSKAPVLVSGSNFVTVLRRPIRSSGVSGRGITGDESDTAIILQGPIMENYSFTVETCLIYKSIFPGAKIIVSTWVDSPPTALRQIAEVAEVVASEPPINPGPWNVNLQLVSAINGATRAVESGATFTLKTRTDQRIYSPESLRMMKRLLEVFPVSEGWDMQKRLIVGSKNTFLRRLYGLSDFLMFGVSSDVWQFYNSSDPKYPSTLRETAYPEVSTTANFLQRSHNLSWTHDDYMKALGECFLVVDSASLDFFWPKYSSKEERMRKYRSEDFREEISFASWLLIHARYSD